MSPLSEPSLTAALAAVSASLIAPITPSDGENSLSVDVGGTTLVWRLEVKFRLPMTEMPSVFVVPASSAFGLGHVSHTGSVCYSDHEGEGFDPANPENVIAFAVGQAVAVLDNSLQEKEAGNQQELLEEFEGYWASMPNCALVPLSTAPVNGHLYAQVRPSKSKLGRGGEMTLLSLDHGAGGSIKEPRRKAHFFSLVAPATPPINGTPINAAWLRNILAQAGTTAQKISQQKGLHVFLFSQPRAQDEALFGVMFKSTNNGRSTEFTQIQPFGIQRAWRDYLLARTGSAPSKKRIAIIGCGSVGSRVAEQLALSGIDELVLIDHDTLTHDNIYRHVLGLSSVGKRKVDALKQELESQRTGLTVIAYPGTAEQWLRDPALRDGCDNIVLTTGKLALERHITRRAFTERWPQRLVSGWLEPLGVGGHVMASKPGVVGCLECLHTDIGGSRPDMRVALLKPGQKLSRNLTGCGGRFMPYSALHAIETALLICKVVLAGSTGYRCWVGDASEAKSLGFEVTNWHTHCIQRLPEPDVDVAHPDCPCCSS